MKDISKHDKIVGQQLTIEQLWWYAQQIANSDFVPRNLRGKPNEVFITMQYGSELGISPMAALHGIAIINGTPSVYGDLLVSLMVTHRDFEDFRFEFKDVEGDRICYCHVKRKGRELFTTKYSMSDARLAKLADKQVWRQYPDHMLMRRSLNTAFHYVFPDALYAGLVTIDSPYGSDNVDKVTLVPARPASVYTVDELPPSKPKVDALPSKKGMDTDVALVPFDEVQSLIGDTVPGRKDITSFYKDFISSPEDERRPHYGTLLNVLLEYLNNDEVSKKALDFINKSVKVHIQSVADIGYGSLDELPNDVVVKMLNRLIRHWIPERIAQSELFSLTCRNLGIKDVLFIAECEFLGHSQCADFYRANRSDTPVVIKQECRDLVAFNSFDYDYTGIEFSEFLPLIDLAVSRINQSNERYNGYLDKQDIDLVLDLCSANKVDILVAIHPFCKYPSPYVVKKRDLGKLQKYIKYLALIAKPDVAYPNDSQCLDLIGMAMNKGTDIPSLTVECTGNVFLSTSVIPISLLNEAGYLN